MTKEFKPYVPIESKMKEFSFKAIFLGVIMAVILGAANAYLGLKAGMTVAATFPAAVIAGCRLRQQRLLRAYPHCRGRQRHGLRLSTRSHQPGIRQTPQAKLPRDHGGRRECRLPEVQPLPCGRSRAR